MSKVKQQRDILLNLALFPINFSKHLILLNGFIVLGSEVINVVNVITEKVLLRILQLNW